MKRTKRTLIALVVVAVVLVAAVLVLVLPDQVSGGEEAASSSSTGSTLYEYASEDLESLAVTNENGTFTIVPDAEATAEAQEKADEAAASAGSSTAASTVTTEFMIEELSGLPQNQTAVNLAAKDGYVFATVKTVTETDDLASYGLSADDPAATLTATFTDGTVKTLYVGTQTPLDSSSRYVREDGSNVVYAANVTETLLGPVTGFVDTGITDYTASEDDNAEGVSAASSPFVKIDIQNQNGTLSLSRSGESQPWGVNGLPASGDAVSTLSASLASMTAQDVVQIDPSDEDLSTYGLSDPAARVSMTTTGGETTTLLIGGTNEDGQYYARLDGGRLVYTLSSSGTSWLSDDEMSLRCLTFLNDDVSAVQSFKMTGRRVLRFRGHAHGRGLVFHGRSDELQLFRHVKRHGIVRLSQFHDILRHGPGPADSRRCGRHGPERHARLDDHAHGLRREPFAHVSILRVRRPALSRRGGWHGVRP